MSFSQQLIHSGSRSRAWIRIALFFGLVALFAVAGGTSYGLVRASAGPAPSMQKYLGYWNYDQPNLTTLNNVGVLSCPDGTGQCDHQLPLPLKLPQVGWVLFSPGPNGTINGHTDQGCTWKFQVTATDLELSSTTQQCLNPAVGSIGNITKWSVTVEGNKEHEQIFAISHQNNGVDLIAPMKSGSRTRVNGVGGTASFSHFLGTFSYDPAELHTLTNEVATDHGTVFPEQGAVQFTQKDFRSILAHTPDGCTWTFAVRDNTAELNPASQTCHLTSSDISFHYWAIVTDDGQHMNAFRAGTTTLNGQQSTNTYLYIGALTRSTQPGEA